MVDLFDNPVSRVVAKLICFFVNTFDSILLAFGIKIYDGNLDLILSGLNKEELEEAKKPEVLTPLSAFAKGLVRDRRLTLVDRYLQVAQLRRTIEVRVGLERTLQKEPSIEQLPVTQPMFIIGFPRTGTTLLYNLLAQDPSLRAPYMFEITHPYPPGLPDNWRQSERYREGKKVLDIRRLTGNSDFDRAHLFRADRPEECLFILFRSFFMYHPMLRIEECTEFKNWFYGLKRKELTEIYKHYKKQLQIIGYNEMKKKRWILKAHVHMLALDALLDVFPDACLIFTYRKLTEMIGSFCSTVEKGTGSWGTPDAQYGQRVLHFLSTLANRTVEVMKQYENRPHGEQPFFNVEYSEMVKRPIETIRSIYHHYGLHLSSEAENAMLNYLNKNKQHKHGSHKYSIEEFGISKEDVKTKFAPYLDYFKNQSANLL